MPHLLSGSSNVGTMSTRHRAGIRKCVGFLPVLEEPQAASTPQAEGGPGVALLKGSFSPPAGCMPWWRGDDLRGPQKGQRLLAVPRVHHLLPGMLEFPCSAEHAASRAVAEPPIPPCSASSRGPRR